MKFKIGDYVKLTKKAVKNFYGREERVDDYKAPSNIDYMSNEHFIQLVDDYMFNTGIQTGLIVSIDRNTIKVLYKKLTGGYDFTFIDSKDLKKVKCVIL